MNVVHIRNKEQCTVSECGKPEPFLFNVFPGIDPPTCQQCIETVQTRQLDRALAEVARVREMIRRSRARVRSHE